MHSDPSTAVKFWSTWVGQLAGAPEPASYHADTGGSSAGPRDGLPATHVLSLIPSSWI